MSRMVATVAALVAVANADVYMHNPRGSNNRLNERSANRNNGNRMFDSQNNNRGGYNKGDVDDNAAGNNWENQYDMIYYESQQDTSQGGKSEMTIEWTNQHGCGGSEQGDPQKLNCDIVIQYMCAPYNADDSSDDYLDRDQNDLFDAQRDAADHTLTLTSVTGNSADHACFNNKIPALQTINPNCDPVTKENMTTSRPCPTIEGMNRISCEAMGYLWRWSPYNAFNAPATASTGGNKYRRLRDGTTTNRQQFSNGNEVETQIQRGNRKEGDIDDDEGLHESWEHYDECYRRERNRGLFTADQNLRNNAFGYSSAVYTRQNPNNNRRGYECPEERDYYPYWHPSPWVDVAILTDRLDRCAFYQKESQNVKPKHACRKTEACQTCGRWNTEQRCIAQGGNWVEVGAHEVAPPECLQAPWSRVNHLGNGRYGQANSYNWTIPHFGSDQKCVVRLRYNISTDDYDGARVNSSFNQNNGQGVQSPVRQNPNVDIGAFNTALRLAINTAQFGRTFQDRSHVLHIKARPNASSTHPVTRARNSASKANPTSNFFTNRNIYNLNVRGKRCNIVQCFPSVEYDFMPNHLSVSQNDIVHIQWTGSNTHNNGNPAGDGQAGDAGEGTRGTDRHNFVEVMNRNDNDFGSSFPAPWSQNTLMKGMVDALAAENIIQDEDMAATTTWDKVKENWAVRMATAGYYKGYVRNDANGRMESDPRQAGDNNLQVLLNNAPASFPGGLFRFAKGRYNYMCTRNHNFSNRDQKGHLIVV